MRIPAAGLALLLAGCAQPPGFAAGTCTPMVSARLLFGAGDDPAFPDFLDRSVSPRFPAGLTVLAAEGRWRSPEGRQLREMSRVVLITVPAVPDPVPALEAVRAEYRARFRQQSVGMLLDRTCASF